MLSTRKLTLESASTYYSKDNYYTHQLGEYFGKLKDELGLDELTHDSFVSLLNGINPTTGEVLTHSKNNKNGSVSAIDFTFSPPKSISIAHEAAVAKGDTELANEILFSHNSAVNAALELVQSDHIKARIQKNGKRAFYSGDLLASKFQHDTNRFLEPQLHTHSVIFNFTKVEGKYRALYARDLFKKGSPLIKNIGQYYRNILQQELSKKSFYLRVVDKSQSFFEIAHINDELVQAFSRRREMIEKAAEKIQKKFPKMNRTEVYQKACLQTRVAKKDVNRDEVRDINIELMSQYVDVDKLVKNLKITSQKESVNISNNDIAKIVNEVKREVKKLNKSHQTPLNIATHVMSRLPINSDTNIDVLHTQIQKKEIQDKQQIHTMHSLVISNLQATKLNTQKLFQSLEKLKSVNQYKLEEVLEDARGIGRGDGIISITRDYQRSGATAEAERTNLRDDGDVSRDIDAESKRRGVGRDESQRDDVATDRDASVNYPRITAEDIKIAERGSREQLKNEKGIEQ